jgi:hypothetical protein
MLDRLIGAGQCLLLATPDRRIGDQALELGA